MENKVTLSSIEEAKNEHKKIDNIDVDNIIIIKRNGSKEKYMPSKMRKVCYWACNNSEIHTNSLLESTKIRLYNEMNIEILYDELIKTAANKISRINPEFEMIAAKLLLLKIYRKTANIKTSNDYPTMTSIIKKGIALKKYNVRVFEAYTNKELDIIDKELNPDYDYLFTYKALNIFDRKYCLNETIDKKFELPQHTYMRIAMSLFYNEDKAKRIDLVIKFYHYLAQHYFTVATPIMLNAGTRNMQLSSCVLSKMGDSVESIIDTARDVAIYSKNKGGNAVDISSIRSSGSYIAGNNGISSGPIPFVKILESTIKAFNQGSERPGVCCVYFQWWHYNFEELIVLKNNSGTEENRARQLKYAVKINDLLIKRFLNDEYVTLFNPVDVPKLFNVFGKEFEQIYLEYENANLPIRTKKIKARDVVKLIMKERVETGNIYLFHEENVNNVSMLNRYINSSNLCTEITLPSIESKQISEELTNGKIKRIYQAGEISLCNLSSINLLKYDQLYDVRKQQELVNILVRGLDNTIDIAYYPVLEGMITNKQYRYLGIGVLNYVNYLAVHKVVIDSKQALELTHELFDKLSFQIITASLELAKIKGKFPKFNSTHWASGQLPIFKANKKALALTQYQPDLKKWKELAEKIKKYGLRNAQLMAIAPTATSGKAINATESIEPIQDFLYKEDGKSSVVTLVPNIKLNWEYYKKAIDCDQYKLIELAAIRQCYLDQAQSINIYFKKVQSITDFTLHHIYGFMLGLKTFYYCKTYKEDSSDVCESCT